MRVRDIIVEKRRNPEMNPRVAFLDALAKYAGEADVFVSFTADVGRDSHRPAVFGSPRARNASGVKLGINPRSRWESTPLGIYAYPVDYVLKMKGFVPFAGDEPFVWVFRATDMKKVLNLSDTTEYDVDKAREFCPDATIVSEPSPAQIWDAYRQQAQSLSWNKPKSTPMRDMARILMAAGYIGAVDYGKRIIHGNEPTQAVFFSRAGIREIEMLHNVTPRDMTKVDLYCMKWKVFYRDMMAGKVDPAVAAATVYKGMSMFAAMTDEQIDALLAKLPEEAIREISREPNNAIVNSYGALFRAFPTISDDTVIEIIGFFNRALKRFPKAMLTPKIAEYIVENFADFCNVLPADLLPPDMLERAIANYPKGLRHMALGEHTSEALQMRYLQLGRGQAAEIADSRYVTPAALVAAVDVLLTNNSEETAYDAMRHWMERVKLKQTDEETAKKVVILVARRHPEFGRTLAKTFSWLDDYLNQTEV